MFYKLYDVIVLADVLIRHVKKFWNLEVKFFSFCFILRVYISMCIKSNLSRDRIFEIWSIIPTSWKCYRRWIFSICGPEYKGRKRERERERVKLYIGTNNFHDSWISKYLPDAGSEVTITVIVQNWMKTSDACDIGYAVDVNLKCNGSKKKRNKLSSILCRK